MSASFVATRPSQCTSLSYAVMFFTFHLDCLAQQDCGGDAFNLLGYLNPVSNFVSSPPSTQPGPADEDPEERAGFAASCGLPSVRSKR